MHDLVERPAPLTAWQLDFKQVIAVAAAPGGKRQHAAASLDSIDIGIPSSARGYVTIRCDRAYA